MEGAAKRDRVDAAPGKWGAGGGGQEISQIGSSDCDEGAAHWCGGGERGVAGFRGAGWGGG